MMIAKEKVIGYKKKIIMEMELEFQPPIIFNFLKIKIEIHYKDWLMFPKERNQILLRIENIADIFDKNSKSYNVSVENILDYIWK